MKLKIIKTSTAHTIILFDFLFAVLISNQNQIPALPLSDFLYSEGEVPSYRLKTVLK